MNGGQYWPKSLTQMDPKYYRTSERKRFGPRGQLFMYSYKNCIFFGIKKHPNFYINVKMTAVNGAV